MLLCVDPAQSFRRLSQLVLLLMPNNLGSKLYLHPQKVPHLPRAQRPKSGSCATTSPSAARSRQSSALALAQPILSNCRYYAPPCRQQHVVCVSQPGGAKMASRPSNLLSSEASPPPLLASKNPRLRPLRSLPPPLPKAQRTLNGPASRAQLSRSDTASWRVRQPAS